MLKRNREEKGKRENEKGTKPPKTSQQIDSLSLRLRVSAVITEKLPNEPIPISKPAIANQPLTMPRPHFPSENEPIFLGAPPSSAAAQPLIPTLVEPCRTLSNQEIPLPSPLSTLNYPLVWPFQPIPAYSRGAACFCILPSAFRPRRAQSCQIVEGRTHSLSTINHQLSTSPSRHSTLDTRPSPPYPSSTGTE